MSVTNREAVLRALREGPKTTAELCQPGCGGERFGARIAELRQDGWKIASEYVRVGSYRYVLVGRVGAASEHQAPGDPLPPPDGNRAHVPAPPRPALGRYHRCDRCGHGPWQAHWPRTCPNCNVRSLWIASFHDELAAARYQPMAVNYRDANEAA